MSTDKDRAKAAYVSIEQQKQECIKLINSEETSPHDALRELDTCITRWLSELRPNNKRNRKLLQELYQWRSHIHTHLMRHYHLGYYDALRSLLLIDRKGIFDLYVDQKDIGSLATISKPIYINNYKSYRLLSEACEGIGQYRYAMVFATNALTSLMKNKEESDEEVKQTQEQDTKKLRERMESLKPKLLQMIQTQKDRLDILAFRMHTCMIEQPVEETEGQKQLIERAEAIQYDAKRNSDILQQYLKEFSKDRIEIGQTKDGGRGLFAMKKIKAGQKISYEKKPLVCGSLSTDDQEYCDNCLSPLLQRSSKTSGSSATKKEWRVSRVEEVNVKKYRPNVVNCDHCTQAKYCSVECRELSWNKWHRVLCGRSCSTLRSYVAQKNEAQDNASANVKHPLLLVKLAAMRLAERERATSGESLPLDAQKEIKMFDLLCSLNDSHTRPDIEHIISVHVNDRELICEEFDVLNDPLVDFRWFIDTRAMLQANNFHACPMVIKQTNNEPLHVYNGISVYGLTSFYNHSCSPNAVADIDDKGGQLVVAKKLIQPGEQIFISYCEPRMSYQDRQDDLMASYTFQCNCEKCMKKQ